MLLRTPKRMTMPIPLEVDLLLCCARARPDRTSIREIVERDLDWGAFLSLAESHSLTSLCCHRLEEACAEAIPAGVLQRLRRELQANTRRSLFLSGELLRIFDGLGRAGVPALALKGPVLAWWIYEHPGLRRFQDLDILVGRSDLDRAFECFYSLGFRTDYLPSGTPKLAPSAHEISLYRTSPAAVVDLHWDLAPPEMGLCLDVRQMLPRAMTVPVAGRLVPTFGVEDQILFCAFHGGKHRWVRLAWLADLCALVESHPPDWPRLLAEARRKHLSRALFVGLRLLCDFFGTPIPAEILDPLDRDQDSALLAEKSRSFLLNEPAGPPVFPPEFGYQLKMTEGYSRKIRYLWRKITVPTAQDGETPRGSRPFRLMRKYAVRIAGLDDGSPSLAR